MSNDSYAFCPCGSGKKIKFCCCADLAADLGRITRMFEGEQRLACLAEVDKLISAGKDRAAFLSIKARLQFELNDLEQAKQTVALFVEKYPDNPLAQCQTSLLQAIDDENCNGVEPLQRALEICDGKIPADLLGAIEAVADRLMMEGKVIAARAHLMLLMTFAKDEDQPNISSSLSELLSTWQIPVLLRASLPMPAAPDDAPWMVQAKEMLSRAPLGVWARTADQLNELTQRFPKEPWLWYQLASLRCWLGQHDAAAQIFRRLANLKHVSLETAVEVEAIAQLLDESLNDETNVMRVVYDVSDTDTLVEFLLGEPHAIQMSVQQNHGSTPDEPPPKAIFEILDKPFVRSLKDVNLDSVPDLCGQLHIFGKQTDRDARAEWIFPTVRDIDYYKSHVGQLLGNRLGHEQSSENNAETISIPAIERNSLPKFPTEGSADELEQFRYRYFNHKAIHELPHVAMKELDGRTPAEAAKIPALRRALLATVLRLDFSREAISRNIDVDQLRTTLGLPRPGQIDPWKDEVESIPTWRLYRLDSVKLSDEQLVHALRQALLYSETRALRVLGQEALARQGVQKSFPEPFVCALLARSAKSDRDALDYLHRAQKVSIENGESPAVFMIAELSYHLRRGETEEFTRVIDEVRLRYLDQPGVAEKLYETLAKLGFRPTSDSAMEGKTNAPVPETVPTETVANGDIWTPDSAKPSAASGKPGIWLPEND